MFMGNRKKMQSHRENTPGGTSAMNNTPATEPDKRKVQTVVGIQVKKPAPMRQNY